MHSVKPVSNKINCRLLRVLAKQMDTEVGSTQRFYLQVFHWPVSELVELRAN